MSRQAQHRQVRTKGAAAMRPKGFLRRNEGTTAVEFAIVAMPFFLMVFGGLQFLFLHYNQDTLSDAVFAIASQPDPVSGDPKRVASNSKGDYQTTVCAMNAFTANCTANLKIERIKLANLSPGQTTIAGAIWEGSSGDLVVLRASLDTIKVIGMIPVLTAKESAVYRLP